MWVISSTSPSARASDSALTRRATSASINSSLAAKMGKDPNSPLTFASWSASISNDFTPENTFRLPSQKASTCGSVGVLLLLTPRMREGVAGGRDPVCQRAVGSTGDGGIRSNVRGGRGGNT